MRLQPRAGRRLLLQPDLFALRVADGTGAAADRHRERGVPAALVARRQAASCSMATHRGLTDLETTMEDTHVWVMNADGANRREVGAAIDNRQGAPAWSPDGRGGLLHRPGARAASASYRLPAAGGAAGGGGGRAPAAWRASRSARGGVARLRASRARRDLGQLYRRRDAGTARRSPQAHRPERGRAAGVEIATVEAFTFREQRLQVRGRGVPHEAGRADRGLASTR